MSNIENQDLFYLDICLNELDCLYQFFFDSADVIRMIQGINRFYSKHKNHLDFKQEIFDKNDTIVHTLAFGGFLNYDIKLLPTHQAELSKRLKANNIENDILFLGNIDNILNVFLERDLAFFSKLSYITTNKRTNFDDDYVKNWIDEKAKEIFKAIYFSYQASYIERLEHLLAGGIIKTQSYELKDIEIWDDELFKSLTDIFKDKRPHLEGTWNNFNDVAAFMYLAKLVSEFNEDNTNRLPIYFDSNSYSDSFPQKIIEKYFTIKVIKEGEKISKCSAFRKWNFFQVYALINPKANGELVYKKERFYLEFSDKRKFIDKLQNSFANQKSKNVKAVEHWHEHEVDEIGKEMANYISADFYRNCISHVFKNKMGIVNKILEDFKKDKLNTETSEIVKRQGDLILTYLNSKIDELLQDNSKMYIIIESRLRFVEDLNRKLLSSGSELDIFYHYSLFRFFIPKDFQNSIKTFFTDGLLSSDDEFATTAKITLWNLYYRTVYLRHAEKETLSLKDLLTENEMYLLYVSFWILSLHDKVSEFNYNSSYLETLSHSLLMLIGACIKRTLAEKQDSHNSSDFVSLKNNYILIVNVLEKRLLTSTSEKKAQIEIALSYLYFYLWQLNGNELVLESINVKVDNLMFNDESENFKAIQFAKKAFEFYEKKLNKSDPYHLYSLNILLYFTIETAPDEEFSKSGNLASKLISLKATSTAWHFRYDDTIARNLHRASMLISDNTKKLQLVNDAIYILENSLKKHKLLTGKDIDEVRRYYENLVTVRSGLDILSLNKSNS